MTDILTNAEIDYAEEQQAFGTLVAHARAANDRMEKDLDIIKRQTAEIERQEERLVDESKALLAAVRSENALRDRIRELGAALREIEYRCLLLNEHKLGKSARYREVSRIQFLASYFRIRFSADALADSPEAAPRLPGAVLQANSDGTISKVDPDPLTAQDKSSMIQWLREMADKLEGKECEQST